MTPEQKEEFTNLKYVRAERGFWTPDEQERWNVLHDLHRAILKKQLQDLDKRLDEARLSKLN